MEDVNVTLDFDALKAEVIKLIEEKDLKTLKAKLADLETTELLFLANELSDAQTLVVFRLLNKDDALSVFEQFETPIQKKLFKSFTDAQAIELVSGLDPDDRVELLDELPASVTKKLINALSPEERAITNTLMGYALETAGRIMTPKFITIKANLTVDQAISKVRLAAKEDKETVYTLFVTDDTKKLEGVIELQELLAAEGNVIIGDIMNDKVIAISTSTDQEEAAQTIKDYDLLAVPVVDKQGKIVGIITHDDAIDIIEFEATEDMYDQAGLANITGTETSRSEVLVAGNIWQVWKVRLPFLLIALIGGLIAAVVMDGFEDMLDQVVIVAFFIPLIMDIGGSVGTQSTTIFARGLSLGHIEPKRFGKHLLREVLIGLSIGILVGALSGVIAGVWGYFGAGPEYWKVGLAVGLALMVTATFASFIGFLVPYILIKLKLDQVAGAAPIITTLKDITGLLVYFLLSYWFVLQLV